jgi:hypothetical protein
MNTKEFLEKGKSRCVGCVHVRGICMMKVMEMENLCPCVTCIVLAMCKIGCEPFSERMEEAHKIHNFLTDMER